MNNISLVISGNLTGFSRFYASPTANDILNEAKFDFDYRNFLTFLNSGDKAYAISFAPSVLAVSLVTRILDSFRRPGVLVVTLLLPRRSKVESALNPQNKNALYQLLNEINEKFYEKNFVNGMVNQNAAVLMQDYYTEILGNYVLVSDGMQRNINSTIEVTSPNKRLGYVQTSEDNVPLYLASPCRRSFEGCHHIFFAQNPVQNLIAEEPVEVVYYRVQITNNRQTLPSVTLNDRIPNIRPDEGEVDIDKNFTYQQVLNGDAGRNIVAELRGETIELTYRFGLEEKSIKFVFNEGGKEIPFTAIMPVLEFNGSVINIPSETYTFQGKEIYGPKRIKSRGTEYRVKRESENLDLRRLQDTCIVQVEHCFSIRIFFNQPEDRQKRIVLKSNHGSFPFTDVTNHLDAVLPGYPEEYSYTIESLYYERESGYLATSGTQIQLPKLRPVSRNTPPTRQGGLKVSNVPMQPVGRQSMGNDNGRRDARPNETYTHSTGKQSGGALQLGGGETNQEQFHNSKGDKFIKAIPAISGILCVAILYFIAAIFFNLPPFSEATDKPTPLVAETEENEVFNKNIHISYIDADGDPVVSNNISYEVFTKYIKLAISPENTSESVHETRQGEIGYDYRLYGRKDEVDNFQFIVSLGSIVINDILSIPVDSILNSSFSGQIKIPLKIRTSEIQMHEDLTSKISITTNEKNSYLTRINNVSNQDIKLQLKSILEGITIEDPIKVDVTKRDLNKKDVRAVDSQKREKSKKDDKTVISSEDDLPGNIRNQVQAGQKASSDGLNDKQRSIVNQYNKWHKNHYSRMDENQKKDMDKKLKSITTFSALKQINSTTYPVFIKK